MKRQTVWDDYSTAELRDILESITSDHTRTIIESIIEQRENRD